MQLEREVFLVAPVILDTPDLPGLLVLRAPRVRLALLDLSAVQDQGDHRGTREKLEKLALPEQKA